MVTFCYRGALPAITDDLQYVLALAEEEQLATSESIIQWARDASAA